MDKRVFAVDFFDNALWDNIAAELRLKDANIYENIFSCDRFKPCEKVGIYLFSQRQWRVLLDTITPAQGTRLLQDLQKNYLKSPSRLWVGSSKVKKILCLSGNGDMPEIFIIKYTAGQGNNIFNKQYFNLNNSLPGQTLEDLIRKGLRIQIFEEVNTGPMSILRRIKDKSGNSLINNAAEVNDKKHWLHYLSFTEKNNENRYNSEQIVHCLDIHYKTFFA